MPIQFKDYITRAFMRQNPDKLFVFGDNCERTGFGGQAKEMRGEPNVVGVRTKLKAAHGPDCYFTDDKFNYYASLVDEDFKLVEQFLERGGTVVFPSSGLGTGLALLSQHAPLVLEHINNWVRVLESTYGRIE